MANRNKNNVRPKNKNFQKNLNKSNSSKAQRRNAEDLDGQEKSYSKTNDGAWYSRFPQLVQDVASISFGRPLGAVTDITPTGFAETGYNGSYLTIPGVMTINFYPGIGYSADKNSAVNRAAIRLFTYMRSHLKTTGTYDSQDMMMMMIALDSCYMFHAYMKRIYGTAQLYTPVNYYYPRALLTAQGVNPDEFVAGNTLMQLRAYINTFAIALGQWTIPADVDLFKRHEWMCSGIYVDGPESRAQTYLFKPMGVWKYNNTVASGSQLDFVDIPVTGISLNELITIGNSLLSAIMGDEDTGDISGDLLNAFGENAVKHISETPENYMILPSYDETVLMQIENLDCVGTAVPATLKITQDPTVNNGAIKFQPSFNLNNSGSSRAEWANAMSLSQQYKTLNFHMDNPTPIDIIEATRLSVRMERWYSATGSAPITCFGADLVSWFTTWHLSSGVPQGQRHMSGISIRTTDTAREYSETLTKMAELSQFDWCPQVHSYTYDQSTAGTTQNLYYSGWFCDAANVGYIDYQELYDMHNVVMISLFDIPQMGFTNR